MEYKARYKIYSLKDGKPAEVPDVELVETFMAKDPNNASGQEFAYLEELEDKYPSAIIISERFW